MQMPFDLDAGGKPLADCDAYREFLAGRIVTCPTDPEIAPVRIPDREEAADDDR
jgi:hypothetical protein